MPVDVPQFIRDNARRGLDYNAEGKGGEGMTDKTLREAREMADGSVSEDKVRRMGPWFARHRVDMDAPANDPKNDDFPGKGAVAWLIWGGSTSGDIMNAAKWAERTVERLDREQEQAGFLDTRPRVRNTMKKTIEEVLSEVNAANAALVTERDELRTAFEALAAEKTTAVEAVTSEVAAKDAKLAELTVAIDGLTAERAELVAKIAALEGSAVSASVEAAKVCASVGVAPVESAPESAPAQKLGIVEQYLALSGAERTAFFMKHGAAIKAALR